MSDAAALPQAPDGPFDLGEELRRLRDWAYGGGFPDEAVAALDRATDDLVAERIDGRSSLVGRPAPLFSLGNAKGAAVALAALIARGPVVVSFYRGGWCPYCNLELRALQQAVPQFDELGATLVAISPEAPDNSLTTAEKHELTFEVLSDIGAEVADAYGVAFDLYEYVRGVYPDLAAWNGDGTWRLPIPATFVVGRDGVVHWEFVDADHTHRAAPADILAQLRRLA